MLGAVIDVVRLSLHIVAACVWVGGQLTLAGLLPALRALGGEAPMQVARQFRRVAWPAYGVLVATGIWNAVVWSGESEHDGQGGLLGLKLGLVALSGGAAYAHEKAGDRTALAVWGALAGLASLATLVVGVVLRG
jgi:putative copper export protein